MITGFKDIGCWQFRPNMGVWQEGGPDPSRRFEGMITIIPKLAGTIKTERKLEGSSSVDPKFDGTIECERKLEGTSEVKRKLEGTFTINNN